jgi:hypothetical protein
MEKLMHQIISDIFHDLAACCAENGERLDAESLADAVGDQLHDTSEEYRNTPYDERRAITLRIAKQYV